MNLVVITLKIETRHQTDIFWRIVHVDELIRMFGRFDDLFHQDQITIMS